MNSRRIAILVLMLVAIGLGWWWLIARKSVPAPKEVAVTPISVDDSYWLNLDRRDSLKYRAQLQKSPQVLVVRMSHYAFNSTNGMGMHYGWLDGKLANLHITFSQLVNYAYSPEGRFNERDYARTEFPEQWVRGHWTNKYDVIVTVTNRPAETMQAEARKFLKQRYGLAWHRETRETEVLLIRATDPQLLQAKASADFSRSKAISELAGELENYFSQPVIDETGATNRYHKTLELVPARWVNGRTTDLAANNKFLASFGLQLVPARRPQEWLVMERPN